MIFYPPAQPIVKGYYLYINIMIKVEFKVWLESLENSFNEPIIKSLLDSDYYKFTMGQVVFHRFPNAQVIYKFINRGKTEFPKGFKEALENQIQQLSNIKLTPQEQQFLGKQDVFQQDYLQFLANYQFKPGQIIVQQDNGILEVTVSGPWAETILWEVPLMSLISELYYKMSGKQPDPRNQELMKMKAERLSAAGVKWIDFGSRRRFSHDTQDAVNRTMNQTQGFMGTSNPYFAMKYNQKPVGTFAHESVMGMQGKYGVPNANKEWMHHWLDEYGGKLGIALTDTVTTDAFLKDFDYELASRFTGVRHDSGDPIAFGEKIIKHYQKLGIDPRTKTIVFSDKLDTDSAINIHRHFEGRTNVLFGIGTHLTNSVGHTPLNIVVKIVSIDFGNGPKDVVKLSDEIGKHTGTAQAIALAKKSLGIT